MSDPIERAQALLARYEMCGLTTAQFQECVRCMSELLAELTEANERAGKLEAFARDLHDRLDGVLPSADAQQRLLEICGDNGELTIGERVNQLVAAYDAECEMDEAREVLRARERKEAPLPCFAGGCSCWKGGDR